MLEHSMTAMLTFLATFFLAAAHHADVKKSYMPIRLTHANAEAY